MPMFIELVTAKNLQGFHRLSQLAQHLDALSCLLLVVQHTLLQSGRELLGARICLHRYLPEGPLMHNSLVLDMIAMCT